MGLGAGGLWSGCKGLGHGVQKAENHCFRQISRVYAPEVLVHMMVPSH